MKKKKEIRELKISKSKHKEKLLIYSYPNGRLMIQTSYNDTWTGIALTAAQAKNLAKFLGAGDK